MGGVVHGVRCNKVCSRRYSQPPKRHVLLLIPVEVLGGRLEVGAGRAGGLAGLEGLWLKKTCRGYSCKEWVGSAGYTKDGGQVTAFWVWLEKKWGHFGTCGDGGMHESRTAGWVAGKSKGAWMALCLERDSSEATCAAAPWLWQEVGADNQKQDGKEGCSLGYANIRPQWAAGWRVAPQRAASQTGHNGSRSYGQQWPASQLSLNGSQSFTGAASAASG